MKLPTFSKLGRGHQGLLLGLGAMILATGSGGLRLVIEAFRVALDPARSAESSGAFFMGMCAIGMIAFSVGFIMMTRELLNHLAKTQAV